jgi:hypothetical protein
MKAVFLSIFLALITGITAYGQDKYEYVTIQQSGFELSISSTTTGIEQSKHKNQVSNYDDYTLILNTVKAYEDQGWELIQLETTSTSNSGLINIAHIRKPRD